MTPEEINNATLDSLQQAEVKMTSPEWKLALRKKPKKTVDVAKEVLGNIHDARIKLENAQLAKIEQALITNEKNLTDGKTNLDNALTDLKNVQNVIDNVTAFFKIVVRILAVVGRAAAA